MNNPFTSPDIRDRNIEKFSACERCNKPFMTEKKSNISIETAEGITTVICLNCGYVYTFRNWNQTSPLGFASKVK